jgi:hypothetical protein
MQAGKTPGSAMTTAQLAPAASTSMSEEPQATARRRSEDRYPGTRSSTTKGEGEQKRKRRHALATDGRDRYGTHAHRWCNAPQLSTTNRKDINMRIIQRLNNHSEYEFASAATIKERIAAIEAYRNIGRGMPAAMSNELSMLKYQWLGNAVIREGK